MSSCVYVIVLITLCIIVLSLSLISSGLLVTSPVYPCPCQSCLDVSINIIIEFKSRLRVLVPSLVCAP